MEMITARVILRILTFVGLCLVSLISSAPARLQYGIIVDAGSSSSKLHVYRWIPKRDMDKVPKFEEVLYKKLRPGVSSFYPNLDPIEDYVGKILATLDNDIMPPEEVNRTRISFLATAGLRFLPESAALAILDKIRSTLGNKTINPFQYNEKDVGVLSGEEEAVFSWLTVNYQLGTFDSSSKEQESVGIIEVGGGSTQVAYTTDVPIYDGKVSVRVGGNIYDVFTHSYLSFGSGKMTSRIQWYLFKENPHAIGLMNPCMLRDDKKSVSIAKKLVEVQGEGNSSECSRIVKEFLKPVPDYLCSPKPCTIGGIYAPLIPDMQFVALGNIYATASELDILNETGELDPVLMESRAKYYCTRNLTEAKNEFRIPERWASSDCQNGLYIPMLFKAIGLHDGVKMSAVKYIKDVKIGWTLGAMLHYVETSYITRCIADRDMC